MVFNVGPYVYRLAILDRVQDEHGNDLLGLAVYLTREIRISAQVPPTHRLDVCLHELWHAWEFHFPPAADEESRCNLNAAVTASILMDFQRQGGIEALAMLAPDQPPTPIRHN
jgi:hypothetical protein